MLNLKSAVEPNGAFGPRWVLVLLWSIIAIVLWGLIKPIVLPSVLDVLSAFPLFYFGGFVQDLISSVIVNVESIMLSALIGLPLAYLCRVSLLEPVSTFIAELRFVGPSVFYLPLLIWTSDGHQLKVGLLTLGMTFYLVTSMMDVVNNIPQERYDDAATLRMGPWQSVWYVVVRGTVPDALRALRANSAMGWAMLMFVEGVVRSEGGIGVVILNAEKHMDYNIFGAAVVVILLVGIFQDWCWSQTQKLVCPYA